MARRLEREAAEDNHDPRAEYLGSRLRRWMYMGWREPGALRDFPGRYELQPGFPPPDPPGIGSERRRVPWREVAPGKTLDRRASSRRHPARRSDNLGS